MEGLPCPTAVWRGGRVATCWETFSVDTRAQRCLHPAVVAALKSDTRQDKKRAGSGLLRFVIIAKSTGGWATTKCTVAMVTAPPPVQRVACEATHEPEWKNDTQQCRLHERKAKNGGENEYIHRCLSIYIYLKMIDGTPLLWKPLRSVLGFAQTCLCERDKGSFAKVCNMLQPLWHEYLHYILRHFLDIGPHCTGRH